MTGPGAERPIAFDGHKIVKTIRSHVWKALGSEGQRTILSRTNVHIIPTDPASESTDTSDVFESWDGVAFLGTMVDLTAQRQCEGNCPSSSPISNDLMISLDITDQSAVPKEEDYIQPNILKRNWNLRHTNLLDFILETSSSRSKREQAEKRKKKGRTGKPKAASALCLNINDIPIYPEHTTMYVAASILLSF